MANATEDKAALAAYFAENASAGEFVRGLEDNVACYPGRLGTMRDQHLLSVKRGDTPSVTQTYYDTNTRKSASMMPESFNSMASIIRAANSLKYIIEDPAIRMLAIRGLRGEVLRFHESNKDDWKEDWYPATLMKEILEVLGGTQTP